MITKAIKLHTNGVYNTQFLTNHAGFVGTVNRVDVTFWQTANRYYFSLLVHTIAGNCIQVHKGKQISRTLFYRLYRLFNRANPYDGNIHCQYTNNQYHFTINL